MSSEYKMLEIIVLLQKLSDKSLLTYAGLILSSNYSSNIQFFLRRRRVANLILVLKNILLNLIKEVW